MHEHAASSLDLLRCAAVGWWLDCNIGLAFGSSVHLYVPIKIEPVDERFRESTTGFCDSWPCHNQHTYVPVAQSEWWWLPCVWVGFAQHLRLLVIPIIINNLAKKAQWEHKTWSAADRATRLEILALLREEQLYRNGAIHIVYADNLGIKVKQEVYGIMHEFECSWVACRN